ncbi:MAG: GNAT family N-acetyltransferase [Actinobacteria bacterium]|nr:GNAT family N-acetyltransferase [Actinomycetota bacterium]
MSVRVRPARPDDLPAVEELLAELDREQGRWRVFRPRPGHHLTALRRFRDAMEGEGSRPFVAEDDGEVVGMALAEVTVPSGSSDERAVELSTVVVRSDARGRGVGRALVAAGARFAGERGVDRLTLKVFSRNPAVRFWEAVGFEPRFVQMTATVAGVLDGSRE